MASTTVVSQEIWHHMGENKLLGEAECQPKLFSVIGIPKKWDPRKLASYD